MTMSNDMIIIVLVLYLIVFVRYQVQIVLVCENEENLLKDFHGEAFYSKYIIIAETSAKVHVRTSLLLLAG